MTHSVLLHPAGTYLTLKPKCTHTIRYRAKSLYVPLSVVDTGVFHQHIKSLLVIHICSAIRESTGCKIPIFWYCGSFETSSLLH